MEKVSFRLEDELIKKVGEMASQRGGNTSPSDLYRELIELGMAAQSNAKPSAAGASQIAGIENMVEAQSVLFLSELFIIKNALRGMLNANPKGVEIWASAEQAAVAELSAFISAEKS